MKFNLQSLVKKHVSAERRKFLCLDEASRVACNSEEAQTRRILLLFGSDRLYGEIPLQACGIDVLKCC